MQQLPILPFLAPRSRRYLKIGPIREYSHSQLAPAGFEEERNDGTADQREYESSLPGTYVEDFAETFRKDKAQQKMHTYIDSAVASEQASQSLGEAEVATTTYLPIMSNKPQENKFDFGATTRPFESHTPVTGTSNNERIPSPFGETEDSFGTRNSITSVSHNEQTTDPLGETENSFGEYTPITSTTDTKEILDSSGETESSFGTYMPIARTPNAKEALNSSEETVSPSGPYTSIASSGEAFHLEEPSHSSGSSRTDFSTSSTQSYTQLRGAYPHTLDEQVEQLFPQGPRDKLQQLAEDAFSSSKLDYFGLTWANKLLQVANEVESDTRRPLEMMSDDMLEKASRLGKYLLLFDGKKCFASIFQFWQSCVELAPHTVPFLLCLLQDSPSKALHALLSSCASSFYDRIDTLQLSGHPPTWDQFPEKYLADALDLIAAYYHQTGSGGSAAFDEIHSEVMKALSTSKKGSRAINNLTSYALRRNCSQEQMASLYDIFLSKSVPLSQAAQLHFAYSFGLNGQYRRAFEVMEQAISCGGDPKGKDFQSISTLTLRRSMLSPNGYHDNPSIIATMLNLGIPINMQHYTVVILNAVEAEDHSTALRTYNLLKENGPITHPWVYSAMLKSCSSSLNIDTFRMVHRDILDSGMLSNDYIAGGLLVTLDAFLLREHKTRDTAAFHELVKLFCQIWDPAPLADLGILPLRLFNVSPGMRKATSFAVGVVLAAFVRAQIRKQNPSLFILEKTYRVFRRLVESGHELVAPLVEFTYVPNAFLYAFAQTSDHLTSCLDIMKDMAAPLPDTAIAPHFGQPIRPAHPDEISWNILLLYFSRHGQTAAAERTLEIMHERGVRPDVVTWNTLTCSYKTAHDVNGLFGVLLRMGTSGFKMNGHTLKNLKYVKDRQKLFSTLDRAQGTTYSDEDRNLLDAVAKKSKHTRIYRIRYCQPSGHVTKWPTATYFTHGNLIPDLSFVDTAGLELHMMSNEDFPAPVYYLCPLFEERYPFSQSMQELV
ncbi:hypothetical protein EV356DRAFT_507176 [Viridothelium virens]|uniref:Pentacotripeptide-repeat region of PRORP domain-containing protein n=1 Tax=Viridothelium virens TaxID=1048519 RepID=A0A6A6GZI5_VIRVR|nr:hypothetical protein EV356DRAFT_507176 [Viridothelium virens]